MNDRSKYFLNGICDFENVPEQTANHRFIPIELGWAGGVKWSSKLNMFVHGNEIIIQPVLFQTTSYSSEEYRIHGHFSVINQKNSKRNEFELSAIETLSRTKKMSGPMMPLFDVLNLKNGWLNENGRLSIEYGIHVESILEYYGLHKFNFYDELINKDNMIILKTYLPEAFIGHYCQKQLISFHLNYSQNQLDCGAHSFFFNFFLQIAHGVRLNLDIERTMKVLEYAEKYEMWNVKHYCEQKLTTNNFTSFDISRKLQLKMAVKLNMTSFLMHSIRRTGSMKKVLKVLKKSKVKKMSSEMMKMIIATCVYGKFLD